MTVYQPREDTYLLRDSLPEDLSGEKFLEIGTGSGTVAVEAAKRGAEVTATDVNPAALETARELAGEEGVEIELVESDLFESVEGKFDLIVFNPPYLPGELEDPRWRGGETGVEVTERFLEGTGEHLEEGGEAWFIASSNADIDSLRQRFELEEVAAQKLWFETLYLFKSE